MATVIFAAVDLGMQGLSLMDMISSTPTLRMTSPATSGVDKVARVTVAGVVPGMRVQLAAL